MNMWIEAMTAIINPIGVPSTALPSIEEIVKEGSTNKTPTVGGSFYLCINPAKFGSIDSVKARSDDYISAIETCPPRPGHSVRVPGSKGYKFLQEDAETVEVLSNHWEPFFVNIAGRYGLDEETFRSEFAELNDR